MYFSSASQVGLQIACCWIKPSHPLTSNTGQPEASSKYSAGPFKLPTRNRATKDTCSLQGGRSHRKERKDAVSMLSCFFQTLQSARWERGQEKSLRAGNRPDSFLYPFTTVISNCWFFLKQNFPSSGWIKQKKDDFYSIIPCCLHHPHSLLLNFREHLLKTVDSQHLTQILMPTRSLGWMNEWMNPYETRNPHFSKHFGWLYLLLFSHHFWRKKIPFLPTKSVWCLRQ